MDEQTMKDYIEDLLEERKSLYERIERFKARVQHLSVECERLATELSRHA